MIRRIKSVPGRHNPAEVIITEPARGVTFPAHLLITHTHFTHTSGQKRMKALKVNESLLSSWHLSNPNQELTEGGDDGTSAVCNRIIILVLM